MRDLVFFDDISALENSAQFLGTNEFIIARKFRDVSEIEKLNEQIAGRKMFKTSLLLDTPDIKTLRKFRSRVDFVAVQGGTPKINQFAVATKDVDFLLMPTGPERNAFDIALARNAAENNVIVVASFSAFLNACNLLSKFFRNYFLVALLCRKRKAGFAVFSCAQNVHELRSVQNLQSFAELLGKK